MIRLKSKRSSVKFRGRIHRVNGQISVKTHHHPSPWQSAPHCSSSTKGAPISTGPRIPRHTPSIYKIEAELTRGFALGGEPRLPNEPNRGKSETMRNPLPKNVNACRLTPAGFKFSKTPHLVMVHDIKENNLLLSDFENQAPSQIQTGLIEMSPVKLPKPIPCMQMRVSAQFWQMNQNLSDSLLLRTRKTPPSF
jgi:hypothetical protein